MGQQTTYPFAMWNGATDGALGDHKEKAIAH